MSGIRKAGALALLLPLTGAALLVVAAPAFASGSISEPGSGVTYDVDTTVRVRAAYSSNARTELRLKSPLSSAAEQVVASFAGGTLTAQNGTLGYDLDTSCATYPSPSCSGRAPAVNGTWTVRLTGGGTDSSTFVLRIPPRDPAAFAAQADGYRAAVLSWRKGDEPDLVGWTLYDNGAVAAPLVGLDACNGASCATTISYSADGTGSHAYALTARRSVAPGSSDTLESGRSEDSVVLQSPPPPPSPAAGGSTGGSTGSGSTGGSGGSTAGGGSTSGGSGSGGTAPAGTVGGGSATGGSGSTGSGSGSTGSGSGTTTAAGPKAAGISTSTKTTTAVAQRRAFGLTFKAFGPKLGIPKLPPLPATQPDLAPALPDGTYGKTLGYREVTAREKVTVPQAAARRVTGAVGSALDSEQFVRSIAGALLLLLTAAHLRRWLGSDTEP